MQKVVAPRKQLKGTYPMFKVTPNKENNIIDSLLYDELSKEELMEELRNRDNIMKTLESENRKLKKALKEATAQGGVTTSTTGASAAVAVVDPEKAKLAGMKLRQLCIRGIKSQMKWKPSLKHKTARFSWSSMCDDATYRVFRGFSLTDKTKIPAKMTLEDFQDLMGQHISASIRYGSLDLCGEKVNITYSQATGELKVTGSYGL